MFFYTYKCKYICIQVTSEYTKYIPQMDNTLYKDQITNQTLDNVIATLISEENHEGVFNVWSNHNEYVVKYTSEYKDDVEFYMVDKNGDYLFSIDTTPEQERILRNEVGAA